jgi:hypothetical protein
MIKRTVVEEKAAVIRLAQIIVQRQSAVLTDAEALTAPQAFEVWAPSMKYGAEQVIAHAGGLYRVAQDVAQSQVHQPPDAAGLLAVYRPIVPGHAGTAADPIPYVYGMDCVTGLYYSYDGRVYLCKGDMLPCVWPPGTAGLWQWEAVTKG